MRPWKPPAYPAMCEHHYCRCRRAEELAAMERLPEAIAVHYEQVLCRKALMDPKELPEGA